MTSPAEEHVSRSLRKVLAPLKVGARIDDSTEFREVLSSLEFFLPVALSDAHRFWILESIDWVAPAWARKTGENQAEAVGLCLIISDQTWTPFRVHLRIADSADEASWIDCAIGERGHGAGGMRREPFAGGPPTKWLFKIGEHFNEIDWVFQARRGQAPRPPQLGKRL